MTKNRASKKAVRARAQQSGMAYQAVLQAIKQSKADQGEMAEFDALLTEVIDASKGDSRTLFYCPHNCSCEKESVRKLIDESEERDGIWRDADDLAQVQHASFERLENLSSDLIDLKNYFVCAHLLPFVQDGLSKLDRLEVQGHRLRITPTHVEVSGVSDMEPWMEEPGYTTIQASLPEGLYAHLVEISKEEPAEWPKYRLGRADQEFLTKAEATLFGPGTVSGQHVFMSHSLLTALLSRSRLVEERFDETYHGPSETTLGLTGTESYGRGHRGTYHNPADAADIREVFLLSSLHDHQMFLLPPGDVRTSRDLERLVKSPLFAEAPKMFRPPHWVRANIIVELMPRPVAEDPNEMSKGDPHPVGLHVIETVTTGFTQDAIEVALIPFHGGDRVVMKLTTLLRYGVEIGTRSTVRGTFNPATHGLDTISFREKPPQEYPSIESWLGSIRNEVLRNPGATVALKDDARGGAVTYLVTPEGKTEGTIFSMRLTVLRPQLRVLANSEVQEALRTHILNEKGRRILGAVLAQGVALNDLPDHLKEARQIWEESEGEVNLEPLRPGPDHTHRMGVDYSLRNTR